MKLQFNIKTLMLVVVIWALPNAFFGWMIRAHPQAFPQDKGGQLFFGLNISLVFFAFVVVYAEVLHRYSSRGRTSAQIWAHHVKMRRNARSLLVLPALVLFSIIFWYYNRFFRSYGLHYGHLAVLILVATVALMVRNEIRNRPMRRDWTAAWLTAFGLRVLGIAWIIGWGYFFMVYKPHLLVWGLKPWFPISPAMLLMMVVLLVLQGASTVLARVVEDEDRWKRGRRFLAVKTR